MKQPQGLTGAAGNKISEVFLAFPLRALGALLFQGPEHHLCVQGLSQVNKAYLFAKSHIETNRQFTLFSAVLSTKDFSEKPHLFSDEV